MSRSIATPGKGRRDFIIHCVGLIGAAAVLLLSSGAARAEVEADRAAAEFRALFDGATGCYARRYDARHLKAHPRQRVTSMTVARTTAIRHGSQTWPVEGDFLMLTLTLRGKGGRVVSGGATCAGMTEGGRLRCWSEVCDGGAIIVSAAPGGRLKLELDRFSVTGCDGEDEAAGVTLMARNDDGLFLLDPLPAEACSATFERR